MQFPNSTESSDGSRRAAFLMNSAGMLLATLALGLAMTSPQAAATTLYKCKLDGKTVFSDTDCPRNVRITKEAKTAKPRVIKIRQKSTSDRSR